MVLFQMVFMVLIFLVGCSPKYDIIEIFIPPKTAKEKKCVEVCLRDLKECNKKCNYKYNQCLKNAHNKAIKIFPKKIKEYDSKMRKYVMWTVKRNKLKDKKKRLKEDCKREVKNYRDKDICEVLKRNYEHICNSSSEIVKSFYTNTCKNLKRAYSFRCKDKKMPIIRSCIEIKNIDNDNIRLMELERPIKPDNKPTISKLTSQFQKSCNKKCNCSNIYSKCFISCGGTIKYKKVCIENCED
jgi:hypothetical protein